MPNSIVKSFAEKTKMSVSEVEKLWDKANKIAKQEYPDVNDDEKFYPIVTGILKKMLSITEEDGNTAITLSDIPKHYTIGDLDAVMIKRRKQDESYLVKLDGYLMEQKLGL